ncbi:hypothetical protein [Spirillospora sp. NPDC048819]|uniref:hypothetical protein n=1 Tax=Spirillospora sp. NPDC048819 TaxID=3155268 RepID=UPI0034110CC7
MDMATSSVCTRTRFRLRQCPVPTGEEPAFLPVGDPIDGCGPDCCGVGVAVWRQGDLVHWRLIGDRWNRDLPSTDSASDADGLLDVIRVADPDTVERGVRILGER